MIAHFYHSDGTVTPRTTHVHRDNITIRTFTGLEGKQRLQFPITGLTRTYVEPFERGHVAGLADSFALEAAA